MTPHPVGCMAEQMHIHGLCQAATLCQAHLAAEGLPQGEDVASQTQELSLSAAAAGWQRSDAATQHVAACQLLHLRP